MSVPSTVAPAQDSPTCGPPLTRPRLGFSPTSPHSPAGIRMDPSPSLPWATATMPLATAAADPPLEPPDERVRSYGLHVGPYAAGSVVTVVPSSGTRMRPRTTNRARANACPRKLSTGERQSASRRKLVP